MSALKTALYSTILGSALLAQGCAFNMFNIPLTFPPSNIQEVTLKGGSISKKILVLDVDGVISSGAGSDGLFASGDSTVNEISEKLRKAKEDDSIKAVVLRVDSPGGGVTASDVIYKMLLDYKKSTGVPVYVSMLDLAASGGYYISMAADEIYAHPTTVTGSIGVIATFPQFEGLGDKVGVYMETIKSGKNKDLTGGFHNMTKEQREILQNMVDTMYGRFVHVVHEGRPKLEEARIRELADGRIYTAEQAVDNGLIDGVLYLDEVITKAKADTGSEKARVVLYRKTSATKFDSVYAKSSPLPTAKATGDTNIGLLNVNTGGKLAPSTEVFNYMWMP